MPRVLGLQLQQNSTYFSVRNLSWQVCNSWLCVFLRDNFFIEYGLATEPVATIFAKKAKTYQIRDHGTSDQMVSQDFS